MKLTPKQERFCLAYVETGNASKAYRQAYNAERMSANAVRVAACKLLVNPNVTLMIEQQQEAHRAAHSVTVETLNSGIERLISQAQTLSSNGNAQALTSWYKALELRAKIHGLLNPPPPPEEDSGAPSVIEVVVVDASKRSKDATPKDRSLQLDAP